MPPAEPPAQNIDINVSLVRQLIATQFPHWAALPIKPVEFGGWDNRTFHLGEDMSVRLPSAAWYAAQVEKEQYWLPKLAPLLPLPIPVPLAQGVPDEHYPWPWSVYRWLEGETAAVGHIADLQACAVFLAEFLRALHKIDPTGGPPPGKHNFFRGGSLMVYDDETRTSIMALRGLLDTDLAAEIWAAAINSTWQGQPVWVHGDYAAGNLLVKQGRLSAVIDFGSSSVGDPACDLTIAWTFLSGAGREAFRAVLPLNRGTWARARGWALWKALITLVEYLHTDVQKANAARHVISEVFEDYKRNK